MFVCLYPSLINAQVAYVCSGSTKSKFHLNPECRGLKNCGGPIKKTTVAYMHSKGRLACKICSSDLLSSSKTAGGSNTISQFASITPVKTIGLEIPKTSKGIIQQVIKHVGYTTSYNTNWLIPNWVAYELTNEEVKGTVPRPQTEFEPDPKVKGKVATHYDYSNSGYTRGHMAPAADMKWSAQVMTESFYLSNICPQDRGLNGGTWLKLEEAVRDWARAQSPIYVVCGPIMGETFDTIGDNAVAIPNGFFKVVCKRVNGLYFTIGFIFPNKDVKGSIFDYSCTVDEVEKVTGFDFFSALPDSIEKNVESVCNPKDWRR